jgi:anionic cell wall polymer biosynthesis LytR-Cps2A-Psr (LCP) family protein
MLYDDPAQNLHINIPAGRQHLDGADALRFARFRLGNDRRTSISDYQRIEHQQMVIAAVVQELITPASILRIPEFIDIFTTYVQSDLNAGQLLWFANQARNVSGTDSLHMYTIPTLGTSGAPAWYELPDGAGIIELVNRTVNPMRRDVTAADLRIAP